MRSNVQLFSPNIYDTSNTLQLKLIEELSSFFETGDKDAVIYADYLLGGDLDLGTNKADILIISRKYGVLLIDVFPYEHARNNLLEERIKKLNQKDDLVYANLIKRGGQELSSRHQLKFNYQSFIYTPFTDIQTKDVIQISNISELIESIQQTLDVTKELTSEQLNVIESILNFASGLMKLSPRLLVNESSVTKGSIMNDIEAQINNFDNEQQKAALSETHGPQRIRGLAGSGKTVILCLKVAAMHARYPEKKILYTFMTKSLYDFAEKLITRFYKLLSDNGDVPDFTNKVIIQHAWGGRNNPGVYSEACRINDVLPLSFANARQKDSKDPFSAACSDLLTRTQGNLKNEYEYVFIDEAQDFKPEFYQICRQLTTDDQIIWAYDNLQNIYDVDIQNPINTFKNEFGSEGIDLSKIKQAYPGVDNDIVLKKSYRNPKQILVAAQAIGFGTYAEQLIQTISNVSHWNDLGYSVLEGDCTIGSSMVINRDEINSPLSVDYRKINSVPVTMKSLEDVNQEVEYVANSICNDIKSQNLRPEDIMVISIDDRYAKEYFDALGKKLFESEIESYNLLADTYLRGFIRPNCVTLSTLYKAKGNEAAAVYILGADAFENKSTDIKMRNKMFVAMTRTKGWLTISGVNIEQGTLIKEYNKLVKNNYKLIFTQQDVKMLKRDNTKTTAQNEAIENFQIIASELKKLGVNPNDLLSEGADFDKKS